MPRNRSKPQAASTVRGEGAASTSGATTLTCPECGKTFTRAAALGAHRRRAHGVVGASAAAESASRRRGAAATTAASPTARSTRRRTATAAGRRRGRPPGSTAAQRNGVNRDALLRALFPAGIPPREDVIRSINSWLDEAERLTRLR
jgi:uncharacterized C2H2 Zn-finger protein